ncbi:MAG: hypothetical protein Kapaf2KO_04410 [Candidatus Kapaibacteriales bacterium]
MKKISIALLGFAFAMSNALSAEFENELDLNAFPWYPSNVLAPSALKYEVLFVGGVDKVQTTATYGNPAGEQTAKQWHDFIGFTMANDDDKQRIPGVYGFVSVNHEMILADDMIGDGGGMTVFAVTKNDDNTFDILDQTLEDGRSGKFFNVDFANTVGETGMNCGGITAPDGRIWTAEEWFRTSLDDAFRETEDFVIGTTTPNGFEGYNGETLERYENLNYMVEIDPRQAKAIRKQYNWGRQPFEGGCITLDMSTAYLGGDATPGLFTKFVCDVPGDFTKGKTYVYKQMPNSYAGEWVEMDMTNFENVPGFQTTAFTSGATGFNRIEWVALDKNTGKVYFTETGRDNPGGRLSNAITAGGTIAYHHYVRAQEQGVNDPTSDEYWDYYGRVMVYDPATEEIKPYLEGGPYFEDLGDDWRNADYVPYPSKHLTNPDGLNFLHTDDKDYMIICEDLNGTSYGRVAPGIENRTCELWLLDMSLSPSVDNLMRIGVVPVGAEVTGAISIDGNTLLVNSQHPSNYNEYPYNNSLTYAITGFNDLEESVEEGQLNYNDGRTFTIYPNPTSREIRFDTTMDAALYDMNGKRLKVVRNTNFMDVREFSRGTYFIQNGDGDIQKLIIQ